MSWARFVGKHACPAPDGTPDTLLHDFMAEILANPDWGLITLVAWWRPVNKLTVQEVADMHRKVAAGKLPSPLHSRRAWGETSVLAWRAAGVRSRGAIVPWGRVAEECAAESTGQSAIWTQLFLVLRRAAYHFENKGGGQEFMDNAMKYWKQLTGEDSIGFIPRQAITNHS